MYFSRERRGRRRPTCRLRWSTVEDPSKRNQILLPSPKAIYLAADVSLASRNLEDNLKKKCSHAENDLTLAHFDETFCATRKKLNI